MNKADNNRIWVVIFWLYFAFIITVSFLAYKQLIPVEIGRIPYYDTIGHFILFGLTGYLAHRALGRRTISSLNLPLGFLLMTLFAIGEELLQLISPYRTASLKDLLVGLLGMLVLYWIDYFLMRKK